MNRYNTLIFDLDGTLWDASEATARGWNAALQETDMKNEAVSAEEIRSVAGMPFEECVRTLFPSLPPSSLSDLVSALDQAEWKQVERHGGRLYDGVADGMKLLSKHYTLQLVSNCQDWYLDAFWKHSRLQPFFDSWDCHGLSGEPKAAMIERMANQNGSGRPIYIGDTEGDRLATQTAGIDFGYAAYGFGTADEAAETFSSFENLTDRFLDPTKT